MNPPLSIDQGLVSLMADSASIARLKAEAMQLPSVDLDWQQMGQLEMLLCGGFSPLTGYMLRAEYESVLASCRLLDGTAWPVPVTLRLSARQAGTIETGRRIALRDGEGFLLAIMTVNDKWQGDGVRDRQLVQSSGLNCDVEQEAETWHLGGSLAGVSMPMHHDFLSLRYSPTDLRHQYHPNGREKVLGWLGSQPIHRAQHAFCQKICREENALLLLLPFGGGDMAAQADYFSLMRAYQKVLPRFDVRQTKLAMLPIPPMKSGLREQWLRVILARNYGCTHVVAGVEQGESQDAIQDEELAAEGFDLAAEAEKIGLRVVPYPRMQYVRARGEFLPESEMQDVTSDDTDVEDFTEQEFLRRMQFGEAIPDWYAFPEVLAEMHRARPPRARLGFTVFFTGLSGAGKSTLARALASRLMELGDRPVTLLDGDIVRRHLSSELGFSREHRDINVRRIGYVASEITKNRGVAICAPIAPYRKTRRDVRAMIEPLGGFIEVHVSTPLETCEGRDRKGLYAKARAGLIPEFTGVSDPYEIPQQAEVVVDTTALDVEAALQQILQCLYQAGYLKAD